MNNIKADPTKLWRHSLLRHYSRSTARRHVSPIPL